MNNCPHKKPDGSSSIIIDKKRFTGVYPRKYKGYCIQCGESFYLTMEEYKRLENGGESN